MREIHLYEPNNGHPIGSIWEETIGNKTYYWIVTVEKEHKSNRAHNALAHGFFKVELTDASLTLHTMRESMQYVDTYVFERYVGYGYIYKHSGGYSLVPENIDSSKERT